MNNIDLSDYQGYWSIPKRVMAKRLTEHKTIIIVKDGVEGELHGEPGHIHIVDNSGDTPKETIMSEEKFLKKYEVRKEQSKLFESPKKTEYVDKETGEVMEL